MSCTYIWLPYVPHCGSGTFLTALYLAALWHILWNPYFPLLCCSLSQGTQCSVSRPDNCLTYTARLWSSSTAGSGSWACPPSPLLGRSPRRNTTVRWFSCGVPRTGCRNRDRRAERSCTPPERAPGSAAGLCGTSAGYSRCRTPWLAWCRPRRTLTSGSRISHTSRSPEPPSDTGFDHPQWERRLGGTWERRLGDKNPEILWP